jgi:hypothetical protein
MATPLIAQVLPPPPAPFLKPVETTGAPVKVRFPQAEKIIDGRDLRMQYVTSDSGVGANLWASFNLPITDAQRDAHRTLLAGSALEYLANITELIVVEVPTLDGKSIHLRIPYYHDSAADYADIYSTYFGFTTELNSQVADHNPISGLLGTSPSPTNDFSSHVSYLFCDDIRQPRTSILPDSGAPGQNTLVKVVPVTTPTQTIETVGVGYLSGLEAGLPYETNLREFQSKVNVMVETDESPSISLNAVIDETKSTDTVLFFTANILSITFNVRNVGYQRRLTLRGLTVNEDGNWSKWSPTNRFPTVEGGIGKLTAAFTDDTYGILVDPPVGIAYLDKGFLVLTDPTLVAQVRAISLHVVDNVSDFPNPYIYAPDDEILDGSVLDGTWDNTTTIYYPSINAQLKARSVISEYTQTFTCLALPNEFVTSNNPTYQEAVDTIGTGNEPVFVTGVGLYNKWGELVAIARPSETLVKGVQDPVVFTLQLVL